MISTVVTVTHIDLSISLYSARITGSDIYELINILANIFIY